MPVSNANIQYIAFDLGGVLAEVDWAPLKILHDDEDLIDNAFFISNNHRAFSTGQLAEDSYFQDVADTLNVEVNLIKNSWRSVVKVSSQSSTILDAVTLPFVMWSNTDPLHFRTLKTELALPDRVVEKSTLSFRAGHLKPDPQFYLKAIEKLGVHAHQILFIDDQQKNIESARTLGIQAIHLPHIHDLKDKLAPFCP